jgi:hypothetical protein
MRYYEAPESVKHWDGIDPADEPGPPDHDEACMVCDKVNCECPSEEEIEPKVTKGNRSPKSGLSEAKPLAS